MPVDAVIIRSPSKNIGLRNVYGRLAICMGKDSTLDIERPAEGGTRVVIGWSIRETDGPAPADPDEGAPRSGPAE